MYWALSLFLVLEFHLGVLIKGLDLLDTGVFMLESLETCSLPSGNLHLTQYEAIRRFTFKGMNIQKVQSFGFMPRIFINGHYFVEM